MAHTLSHVAGGYANTLNNVSDLATHCFFALKQTIAQGEAAAPPSVEFVSKLQVNDYLGFVEPHNPAGRRH